MLNILVCCANGAGTSLMMKMTAEKVIKSLNVTALCLRERAPLRSST